MSLAHQIVAIASINLRSIPQRLGSSCVMIVGIAGVVAVLVSVLAMASSLSQTVRASAHSDRAIVLRRGANSEAASTLSLDATALIADAPGIARTPDQAAAISIDALTALNVARKADGELGALSVRGVSPASFFIHPEIQISDGRAFSPGILELIVGRSAQEEFEGMDLGSRVTLFGAQWTIVGVYESGNALESSLLTDVRTLMSVQQRSWVSSVTVLLDDQESFDILRTALTTNPALSVEVLREHEYYEQQSGEVSALLFFVTYVVSAVMAVGALFGALNTMYSAVSDRAPEISILRAIGFHAGAVVVSVILEALALALIGGLLGALIAWLLFAGNTVSLGGVVGSVVTELRVTPDLVVVGLAWACSISLVGALAPAVSAARLPVATALRAG
jgi:putative ABC transport system permease protein